MWWGSQEGHLIDQFPHPFPLRAVRLFIEQLLDTDYVPARAHVLFFGLSLLEGNTVNSLSHTSTYGSSLRLPL